MGQYYFPLLIDDNGDKFRGDSHDFDTGLKLMEHSWVGNNFVNAILGTIESHPMRLAWVGDYSDGVVYDYTDFGDGFIVGRDAYMPYYSCAMESTGEAKTLEKTTPKLLFDLDCADYFVVNITKQIYIDLEKYVSQNAQSDFGFGMYCINPIPLLTSIGNGEGGGDYGGREGISDVGTWAFDKIYISAIRPGTMKEVEYHFSERS